MLILPGNHDVNIVDRVNPARLDLPFSPVKTLRKMRALSAIAAVQGERVARRRASRAQRRGPALADALEPRRQAHRRIRGRRRLCGRPLASRGSGTISFR